MKGIKTETGAVTGAIAPSILLAIQSLHADLVVMCSHGFTGFKRWALGSVAERVLHATKVPLMIVHSAPVKQEHHNETQAETHRSHAGSDVSLS